MRQGEMVQEVSAQGKLAQGGPLLQWCLSKDWEGWGSNSKDIWGEAENTLRWKTSAEALVGKFSAFKGEWKDKPGEGEFWEEALVHGGGHEGHLRPLVSIPTELGARGELWVEEKYNASYILKWTILPLCGDQYMGWSQAENMSLWRAGVLLKWWRVLLPYSGQRSSGGSTEKGVKSIVSIVCATRLDVRVTRKRSVWDDSRVWVFPKCWLMRRAGWCTVHKSRAQHRSYTHTHTHTHTHTTLYMSVTNSHSLSD